MKTVVALVVVAAGCQAGLADLLYSQDWYGGNSGINSFVSNLPGWTFDEQVADDFAVSDPNGWLIDSVAVWGVWTSTVPPDGPPLDGFNIRFPVDTGAGPSDTLMQQRLGVTTYTQTDTGWMAGFYEIFRYDIALDPAVLVARGTNWVSVQAIRNERWYWIASAIVPPLHGSNIFVRDPSGNNPDWGLTWNGSVCNWDVAFALSGTVVPEPGTLVLLGLTLAVARRRRIYAANALPTLKATW